MDLLREYEPYDYSSLDAPVTNKELSEVIFLKNIIVKVKVIYNDFLYFLYVFQVRLFILKEILHFRLGKQFLNAKKYYYQQ